MASSAGSQAPGSSRPRAMNTCQECRRRKVRCDRKRPACTRCAGMRPALSCIYDTLDTRPRAYQFVPAGRPAPSSLTSSASASNAAVYRRPGESADQVAPDRLQLIEEQLERLNHMIQSLRDAQQSESPARNTSTPGVAEDLSMPEDLRTPLNPANTASSRGYLDVRSAGHTRYISRAFWASMCNEISELQSLARAQGRSASYVGFEDINDALLDENAGLEHASDAHPRVHQRLQAKLTRDLRELRLPSRAISDALFEAYIYNVHPVAPLVHVPSFRREYQRFWESGPLVTNQIKLSSAPLILAALFAGAVACTDDIFRASLHNEDRDELVDSLRGIASLVLRQSGFPQVPTVEALSAYMLVQGTLMTEEEPLLNCGFVGVVIRVAQMLGLNRDPSQFEAQLSPLAAEVRRRVWWHAYYLDVCIALASGLPSLIVDGSWEVRQLSELRDEHIGTVAGQEYEKNVQAGRQVPGDCQSPDTLVCPLGICLQGKMENAVLIRKLLDKSLDGREMTLNEVSKTLSDLANHKEKMELKIKRLFTSAQPDSYENNNYFNTWASMMLSAMGDQHWWFLYTPVSSGTNNPRLADVHTRIIDHSCRFLQKFMCLSACRLFERFHWAWPGNHQPLHVVMTLICEVERMVDNVALHELCQLVDQALALCSPQGGLTGSLGEGIMSRSLTAGGQETWEVLLRQRTRAWIKTGANSYIPTRKESQANAEELLGTMMDMIAGDTNFPATDQLSFGGLDSFGLNWHDWNLLYGTE